MLSVRHSAFTLGSIEEPSLDPTLFIHIRPIQTLPHRVQVSARLFISTFVTRLVVVSLAFHSTLCAFASHNTTFHVSSSLSSFAFRLLLFVVVAAADVVCLLLYFILIFFTKVKKNVNVILYLTLNVTCCAATNVYLRYPVLVSGQEGNNQQYHL